MACSHADPAMASKAKICRENVLETSFFDYVLQLDDAWLMDTLIRLDAFHDLAMAQSRLSYDIGFLMELDAKQPYEQAALEAIQNFRQLAIDEQARASALQIAEPQTIAIPGAITRASPEYLMPSPSGAAVVGDGMPPTPTSVQMPRFGGASIPIDNVDDDGMRHSANVGKLTYFAIDIGDGS